MGLGRPESSGLLLGLGLRTEGQESEVLTGKTKGRSSGDQDQKVSLDSGYTERASEFRSKTQLYPGINPRASEQPLVNLKQGILGQEMHVPLRSHLLQVASLLSRCLL